MLRRLGNIAKVIGIVILILGVLSLVASRLVQRPDVQKYLVQQATDWLSKKLHTRVSVGHVDVVFFKKLVIRDVYIADQKNDTLLYAGNIKADISLFSLVGPTMHLKVVSANKLVFNLYRHRGDKNYNLQFLLDALADSSKHGGSKIDVQISKANLQSVRVRWLDEPNNTDLNVAIRSTAFDISKMDFSKSTFNLKSLIMDSPVVAYHILVPPPGEVNRAVVHPIDSSRIFLPEAYIKVTTLKLNGGAFYLDDLNQKPTKKGFDPFHIHVTNITFNLQKVRMRPDSITADFKQFTAFETHGFKVRKLTGHANVSAFKTEIRNMYLQTDNSELRNYYAMQYRSFYDFVDYINSMYMVGHLRNSKVSFKDIGFFAPDIDYMKEDVYANGDVTGTVNRLNATNVKLKMGQNTVYDGDIAINGLPDIEETYFDIDAQKFTTTEEDMRLFYPALKLPDNLKGMGLISYAGIFNGFYNDFVAKGNIVTDHGSAYANVVLKLDPLNKVPGYSAIVSTNGLDLGKLLGNSSLGNMDMNGEISGSGFSSTNDSTVFHGIVKSLAFNNYTYKNIALDGSLRKKMFEGQAGITDDNITLFFKGVIDLNKSNPVYKFTASVNNANLKKLSFYKDDIVFNGDIDVDGTGNNLDDALGSVNIKNILLQRDGKRLSIPSLSMVSRTDSGMRIYTISSDKIVHARITGQFLPTSIPSEWAHVINLTLPALHLHEDKFSPSSNLTLNLRTLNITNVLNFFVPGAKGFDNSTVSINFNDRHARASVFIPNGSYKKNVFNNTYIALNTQSDSLELTLRSARYYYNTNAYIDSLQLYARGANNRLEYTFKANSDTSRYKTKIVGSVLVGDSSLIMRLSNALFVVNGHKWNIDAGNTLILSRQNIEAHRLNLYSGLQSIQVQTDSTDLNRLNFTFNNLQLGDYYNIYRFGGVKVYGIISGTLSARHIMTAPLVWADINIKNTKIDQDTLGDVFFKSKYDPDAESVTLNSFISGKNTDIKASGNIYTSTSKKDIHIDIDVAKVDLKPASDFLKDFFSHVKGNATGKLLLNGTTNHAVLNGDLLVPAGELTVNYLNTHYRFVNEKIHFLDNAFEFNENDVFDAYNNKAKLSGAITHKNFGSWGADLSLSANKFQVLNTGEADNNLFYGKAFASGTVKMKGLFESMVMDIALRSEDGTVISIPINSDLGLSGNDFVRFAKKDTLIDKEIDSTITLKTGIKINLDMDINPKAEVKMIFNKKSGDIIDGTGSGNIRMEINTQGDFKMFGTYTIDNGNYLFTLPEILTTKYFNIDKGGTVTWSGDPYGAIISLSAIYPRKVLMESLIAGTPYENALTDADKTELAQRLPVSIYLKLNGSLFAPDIDFDIIVPPEVENMFGIVSRRLQEIKQDKSELNKQVFGLLVFNKFLPSSGLSSSSSSSSSSYTSGAIESTVGEFFADQMSYWLSQINTKTELNVNYYGGTTTPGTADLNNYQALRQAQVELSQKLFNDKLKVVVGSNIDFGTANGNPNVNNNTSANFAGDFLLEYKLKDNFKLGAYRRTQYDYTSELNRIRTGGKISYKLEFDKWGDWRKHKAPPKRLVVKPLFNSKP